MWPVGPDQKVEADKDAWYKRVSPVVGVIMGFKEYSQLCASYNHTSLFCQGAFDLCPAGQEKT